MLVTASVSTDGVSDRLHRCRRRYTLLQEILLDRHCYLRLKNLVENQRDLLSRRTRKLRHGVWAYVTAYSQGGGDTTLGMRACRVIL